MTDAPVSAGKTTGDWPRDGLPAALCVAACAALLALASFGPWDGGRGPRLLPLCAAVWVCAALLPQTARSGPGVRAGAWAALPFLAAGALHDDPQGTAGWLQAATAAAFVALSWHAAQLASSGTAAARAGHALFGAVCLALPALEASIGIGGAPSTGGAPGWLEALAGVSPLRVLLLQAGGGEPASWLALVAASASCAALHAASRAARSTLEAS